MTSFPEDPKDKAELVRPFMLRLPSISTNWFFVYATSADDAIDILVTAIKQNARGSADYSQRDLWDVVEHPFIGPGWRRKDGGVVNE